MAERQKGIGRGLAAILTVSPKDEPEELRQIPVELVDPNPSQPRRTFDEESLGALAESIRARGILQPILVRPLASGRYELVAGERRLRAAQIAEMAFVPAVVRHHDDASSLEVALIENMVREDLNPVEEARACVALVEELGLTREEVGLRVGRSRVAVSNLMRLLDLPDEALDLLERREITEGHGRALLLSDDNATRRSLARQAVASSWSVREVEARARATASPPPAPSGPRRPGRPGRPGRSSGIDSSADRQAAIDQISDLLGEVLGVDVTVRSSGGGFRATVSFESLDEARALATRLRVSQLQ
ncbi:MAG: ParB/RepB/Spo0J family partition protein [Solirubrobacteraceae bacterium]